MQRTLKDLKPGETAKVSRVLVKGVNKRRLMDMGVIRGTDVRVEKIAPLGDPIEITLKGYNLSLRKADAENIIME